MAWLAVFMDGAPRLGAQSADTYRNSAENRYRNGDLDGAIADVRRAIALDPGELSAHELLIGIYWDRAYREPSRSEAEKREYALLGAAAADAALRVEPDAITALVFKGLFLRVQASLETDADKQAALLKEAQTYQDRATSLKQAQGGLAPPPPPLPPESPVRVGADIAPPKQLVRVEAVYPGIAQAARVQGVVILEATIDSQGNVSEATVLRSIPLLDQAAIDAVRQWKFAPTSLNGVPVPVIMSVVVNFTLK